jgi:hypothetical protein
MKIPGARRAFIDLRKLEEYSLSLEHPRGRHKARVFQSALNVSIENAAELELRIRQAIAEGECAPGESDRFGERYTVDFHWARQDRRATVRTTWIFRTGEDFPRLTSCYVL